MENSSMNTEGNWFLSRLMTTVNNGLIMSVYSYNMSCTQTNQKWLPLKYNNNQQCCFSFTKQTLYNNWRCTCTLSKSLCHVCIANFITFSCKKHSMQNYIPLIICLDNIWVQSCATFL